MKQILIILLVMIAFVSPVMASSVVINAHSSNMTQVAGTWGFAPDATQTSYDSNLVSTPGFFINEATHNIDDMVSFGTYTIPAGTYTVYMYTVIHNVAGISQIWIGSTKIGEWDNYGVSLTYDVIRSTTFTLNEPVTGQLQLKVSGKNAQSTSYYSYVSGITIIGNSVDGAVVKLWAINGAGNVYVYDNDVYVDSMYSDEGNKSFYFHMGDTFKFQAYPNTYWSFDKWCYGFSACSITTSSNPFTGTITESYGDVLVYFAEAGATPTPTPTPTSTYTPQGGNADIHLWKVLGAGEVYVDKNVDNNYSDIGHMGLIDDSITVYLNSGETYTLTVVPKDGWILEKICVSDNCSVTWNTSDDNIDNYYPKYTGVVTQSTSNLYVYFRPKYLNITIIRASGEGIVQAFKNDHVNEGLINGSNSVNSRYSYGENAKFVATPMDGRKFIQYCTANPCAYGEVFTNPTLSGMTNGNPGTLYVYFTGNYKMSSYVKPASLTNGTTILPGMPDMLSGIVSLLTSLTGWGVEVPASIGILLTIIFVIVGAGYTYYTTVKTNPDGSVFAASIVGILILIVFTWWGIFPWQAFFVLVIATIGIWYATRQRGV